MSELHHGHDQDHHAERQGRNRQSALGLRSVRSKGGCDRRVIERRQGNWPCCDMRQQLALIAGAAEYHTAMSGERIREPNSAAGDRPVASPVGGHDFRA